MSESNMQVSAGSIFICYRREDSADVTGRVYDRLIDHFGPERVFMDVEAIRLGYDFRSEIDQTIKVCSIVVVVIGDKWLAEVDGKRRIDDENDRVRIEIEAALRREIPIIPILTRGASHPTKAILPASLEDLAYRHGTSIRHEHFRGDVDSLISQLDKLLARQASTPSTPAESKETTPVKSTQTTQSQPAIPPVPSISAIADSKEPVVWTRKRMVMVTAVGATVVLLLAMAGLLTRPHPPVRKAASTSPESVFKPAVAATPTSLNTASQAAIFTYHRLVDEIRYPGTEITPAVFEAQMKQLQDSGLTVISLQDFLAWRRREKDIPLSCAIITFDDGWKSQYEIAWPILKRLGYPFTMFIYTEGVRGGSLGGAEAITWEQLAQMRDAGVDIEAHSATHQDLREGHNIMLVAPGRQRTRTKLTGPAYEQWVQNEVVGSKQLLEQRLGIKVNCFAVPFGNYNEQIKEIAKNAGYEALFTVYGQNLTFDSPLDSCGRYLIEANKPQVFTDAVNKIRVH
jgi:peptidoglycan/xylan/chitin deacetylase (PgdA/CDA1 family)